MGYREEARTDPLEALELFQRDPGRFDAVITDMTMPGITVDLLAKEILSTRTDMPLILCTGYSERTDEESAKAIGFSRYPEKPLDQRRLASALREALHSD